MIFIDTNVLIQAFERARVLPRDPASERAVDLLRRVAEGSVAATTSEAVIVEVTDVLTSPALFARTAPQVATLLTPFIAAPGLRLAPKLIYRRALQIWADRPNLGFVDALTVAYVEQGDVELASFDRQLLASPGVRPYWGSPEAAT